MNLVIILSDQHSKRMLGCYGNEKVKTPNLDRLGRKESALTMLIAILPSVCRRVLCLPRVNMPLVTDIGIMPMPTEER